MWKMREVLRWAAALACQSALAAQAAVVGLNPSTDMVDVGDVFTVTITGSNFAANVDGGALSLTFDPSVLEVAGVTIDPAWNFMVDAGRVDNAAGTVTDIEFLQFGTTVMGAFDIAAVDFQAKGPGTSVLGLLPGSSPFGSGGSPIPVDFLSGSVQVQAIPEPSVAWLTLAGIGLLFVRRLRAYARQRE